MTGIIPLYKGENITSFFAVAKVRRIAGEKKAGHTGTLDPNATGVLPIALGGATRFIELLPTHKKAYKATFKTGVETDTLDIWGQVLRTNNKKVALNDVLAVADNFRGEASQQPALLSALSAYRAHRAESLLCRRANISPRDTYKAHPRFSSARGG